MSDKTPVRRVLRAVTIKLNRSQRLEGKTGYYDGRLIKTAYIRLPQVTR
jgi:hypothetical protein